MKVVSVMDDGVEWSKKKTPEILRGVHLPCLMIEPRAAAPLEIPVNNPWYLSDSI